MTAATYTLLPYRYTDAAGYKEQAVLVADGTISEEQKRALAAVLDVDDTFIPTQLGLPHLGIGMESFPDDDDHCWHALLVGEITSTAVAPAEEMRPVPVGTVTEFVDRFVTEGTRGWDDTVGPDGTPYSDF